MSKYLAESYDKVLRENDALRQENERLVAANKARAEYLTTRRAGNDVDSYVNLAEAEIAALRSRLAEVEARHQRVMAVIRLFCAKYTPDLLAEFDAIVTDSAAHREDGSHE